LVCFEGKYVELIKKYWKFKKSAYELITSRATGNNILGRGLGSLALQHGKFSVQFTYSKSGGLEKKTFT